MKKRDLERQQRQFQGNTKTDGEALRRRVSADLNVVKDAYDAGAIALTELQKQFANIAFADNPSRELALLSKAYADIAKTLVLLRGEGRTTIAEAVASQTAQTGDPPAPDGDGSRGATTPTTKFSSANSSLVAHTPTLAEAMASDEDDE